MSLWRISCWLFTYSLFSFRKFSWNLTLQCFPKTPAYTHMYCWPSACQTLSTFTTYGGVLQSWNFLRLLICRSVFVIMKLTNWVSAVGLTEGCFFWVVVRFFILLFKFALYHPLVCRSQPDGYGSWFETFKANSEPLLSNQADPRDLETPKNRASQMQQTKQNKTIVQGPAGPCVSRALVIDDERAEYPLSASMRVCRSEERWRWGINEAVKFQHGDHLRQAVFYLHLRHDSLNREHISSTSKL